MAKIEITSGNESADELVEIDITTLEYFPLPRAPKRWEERRKGDDVPTLDAGERFKVFDAGY